MYIQCNSNSQIPASIDKHEIKRLQEVKESIRFQQEIFMMQNHFAVNVFNTNPKRLKSHDTALCK